MRDKPVTSDLIPNSLGGFDVAQPLSSPLKISI